MKHYRLKHNFTAGEVSRLISHLVDYSRYKNGCFTMKNMMALSQGPCLRRTGFEYIYSLNSLGIDTTDPVVRIIPFIYDQENSYVLIMFNHTSGTPRCVFGYYDSNGDPGLLESGGSVYYLDLPNFDIDNIDYAQKGDELYIAQPNREPCRIIRNSLVSWSVSSIGWTSMPSDWSGGADPLCVVDDGGVMATETTDIQSAAVNDVPALPATPAVDDAIYFGHATYEFDTISIVTGTQGAGTWTITWEYYDGDSWEALSGVTDGTSGFTSAAGTASVTFQRPSDWADEDVNSITGKWVRARVSAYTSVTTQPLLTSATVDLSYGWPNTVIFFQQRLVYGGNALRPQTVWMSKAGDFFDFTTGTAADDALTFTIDSGTQNKIQWLSARRALNIGTLGDEWTVTGGDQVAITPTNIHAQRHTGNGSEKIKPLEVNFATLFVERHARVINEFVYDYKFDSYTAVDISVLAPHITQTTKITGWAYQQTPYSIIWAVLDNGEMAACTYQRDHKVVGWHRHITDGDFKTIATIPSYLGREDDLWTVVHREINSTDVYYIERKAEEFEYEEGTAADGRFLDCFGTYSGVATDTISGLDYLEGETVGVLAEGAYHPDCVVTSGEITLEREYTDVVVGMPYTSELRPVLPAPLEQAGTTMGRLKRILNLYVAYYRCIDFKYGTEDAEGDEVSEEIKSRRVYDETGVALALSSDTLKIPLQEGWDTSKEYFLRQEKPLPMTILAVTDEVEVGE